MSKARNVVRRQRLARGWSQEELARRTELSRAAISAIETGRVVPSTVAALVLASAFGCRVEDLFRLSAKAEHGAPAWAWPAPAGSERFWRASVGARALLYPVERTAVGALPADGVARDGVYELHAQGDPGLVAVVAGCDPAVGLLRAEVLRATGFQVLPLVRSSRRALELVRQGVVHVAGVHLQDSEGGNARAVRELLGAGYTLLRVARWQEGLALAPGLGIRTIKAAVAAKLRWVSRETGSGARRCQDAILRGRRPERRDVEHVATDHTAVVETIRTGWAQAGVCVRLPAAEAGLDFLVASEEEYDLCFRTELEHDPRVQAITSVVRSRVFRRALDELPGYDASMTGDRTQVRA